MKERTKATVNIMRGGVVISEGLITASSRYVYKLMGEHYISLSFVSPDALSFRIGDYIDDELFGRFYLTKEVMPSDDYTTLGYKYDLRFDAWYKTWENRDFMLVTTPKEDDNTKIRKESIWYLTADLKTQLSMVVANLNVLGYDNVSIDIQDSLETQNESIFMSYSGTKIITALNKIAEAWKCEYWITGTEEDCTIHFGKCESGEAIMWERGVNVEKMTPSRNADTYANKFFIYGSTDNVPLTYRKVCEFTPQLVDEEKKLYDDIDPSKVLKPHMFNMESETIEGKLSTDMEYGGWDSQMLKAQFINLFPTIVWKKFENLVLQKQHESICSVAVPRISIDKMPISLSIYADLVRNQDQEGHEEDDYYAYDLELTETLEVTLKVFNADGLPVTLKTTTHTQKHRLRNNNCEDKNFEEIILGGFAADAIPYTDTDHNKDKYYVDILYRIDQTDYNFGTIDTITYQETTVGEEDIDAWWNTKFIVPRFVQDYQVEVNFNKDQNRTVPVKIHFADGSDSYICVNPYAESGTSNTRYIFVDEDNKQVDITPTQFTIDDEYSLKVPAAYYTNAYDNPSSLMQIGDRRLMLPLEVTEQDKEWICKDGYLIRADLADNPESREIVELAVAFDKIYPDGKLVIKDVETEVRNTINIFDDGSQKDWKWLQYHVTLQTPDGGEFIFDTSYVLEGGQLRMRFLTPSDINDKSGTLSCKLAGMQFVCGFAPSTIIDSQSGSKKRTQDYAIVRNEDFGAKLPNEVLMPSVGDPVTLIGWDVRAIGRLGLVADAEQRLLAKGIEYAKAVEESQFTIENELMSDYVLKGLTEALVENIEDYEDDYELPQLGQKITIKHGALKNGEKTSRIIGIELKLDKPYDTPKYTVGETDAYSRLKQLEKEVTKLTS